MLVKGLLKDFHPQESVCLLSCENSNPRSLDTKTKAEVYPDFFPVLSDPHKRAIYDCLGKKGLEEQGWQIVKRTKTPQEIREEYEQLAK